MNQINKNMLGVLKNKENQMRYVAGEVQGLRVIISYLWDGNQEAFNILYFLKSNYKEWPKMILWLRQNNLKGKALVDMFKNESPDGGGYHMGATYILSKLKGIKFGTTMVKVDELL